MPIYNMLLIARSIPRKVENRVHRGHLAAGTIA
jgi:hypothetical protein